MLIVIMFFAPLSLFFIIWTIFLFCRYHNQNIYEVESNYEDIDLIFDVDDKEINKQEIITILKEKKISSANFEITILNIKNKIKKYKLNNLERMRLLIFLNIETGPSSKLINLFIKEKQNETTKI